MNNSCHSIALYTFRFITMAATAAPCSLLEDITLQLVDETLDIHTFLTDTSEESKLLLGTQQGCNRNASGR